MDGKYILVATGGVTHPQLEISVYAMDNVKAIERSKEMAARLMAAGYFGFDLYHSSDTQVRVARLVVCPQPPDIRVR